MKTFAAALTLAFAVAGCAPAAAPVDDLGPDTYEVWDANNDNCLAGSEFGVNWNDEFGVWDDDDTGFIENDEWGVEVGLNDDDFGAFDTWDVNDDNLLDPNEFGTGSFGVFDDNDDNCIGADEWNAGIGVWE